MELDKSTCCFLETGNNKKIESITSVSDETKKRRAPKNKKVFRDWSNK